MSARSSALSADAPAWYPSTYVEAAIKACPAAEPPSVAEEAKQAPVSPATSGDTVALQATVDSGRDGDGAIPRDVIIASNFPRAELLEATVNGTGSNEEKDNDGGSKEKGGGSDGSAHAVSDPGVSDDSELGATSPEGHSSSTAWRRLTRGQLWGLGVAALSVVVLVVGLSRRRRAG